MDVEKTMEFILDQMAQLAVQQAEAGERQARAEERHDREISQIRGTLDRAVRLGIREARHERRRRQALDDKVAQLAAITDEKITQLAASHLLTEEKLQGLIDALRRGGNGSN